MGLNDTPTASRIQIGLFGNRNAGKSSLMNAITAQDIAIVSPIEGTTTDPVRKAMELLPLGPIVMIDTPGLNDEGELGSQRVKKSFQVLHNIQLALFVTEGKEQLDETENMLLSTLRETKTPYIIVVNKCDLLSRQEMDKIRKTSWYEENNTIFVSAKANVNMKELKDFMAQKANVGKEEKPFVRDLMKEDDVVILVTPIDEAAPKGRMILPQQQAIRDILDGNGICMVTKPSQLEKTLESLKEPPKMVITDSQAFKVVNEITPKDVPLTSFSILLARKKGNLEQQIHGAMAIQQLKDGDKVLISEGCTHHRQCGDIGTQKLPNLIKKFTGKKVEFVFTSGTEFKEELQQFAVIIHCGGCMLGEQEMKYRLQMAHKQKVPMTNYGIAIAYMNGILERSIEML